jgi:malonyl-ACP O-methyltransferase BioC
VGFFATTFFFMQSKFISRNRNNRLILIFAGWGMDARPFKNLSHPGYDILVVWDYRDLTFNWQPLLAYHEICLIAWSMGVFAASLTIHEIVPRITKRIAVNGTLEPVSSRYGIPEAIYHGTLNALSPTTLRKFYRRMCTSAEQFAAFDENRPKRTISELAEELQAIETHTFFHVPQVDNWDLAVISRNDGIFPQQNQVNAWRLTTPIQFMDAGHLPDFQMLISRLIIDKDRVSTRFGDSKDTYSDNATVQRNIAEQLFKRYMRVTNNAPIRGNVIEAGVGAGALTRLYAPMHTDGALRLWDIADIDTSHTSNGKYEKCDAEVNIRRTSSSTVNCIFSASTVQWFNSPASFLRECERVLVPGGYLVLSTFVRGNLQEITNIVGNGLPLLTADGWLRMMPQNMMVQVCEQSFETMAFASPREVLEHLRKTGVNAVGYGQNRAVLARRILEQLPQNDKGEYTLTYRPLYLIARKLDE